MQNSKNAIKNKKKNKEQKTKKIAILFGFYAVLSP